MKGYPSREYISATLTLMWRKQTESVLLVLFLARQPDNILLQKLLRSKETLQNKLPFCDEIQGAPLLDMGDSNQKLSL